jgi:hypothetical protein
VQSLATTKWSTRTAWLFLLPVGRPRPFCLRVRVDRAMGDAPYRRRHENLAGVDNPIIHHGDFLQLQKVERRSSIIKLQLGLHKRRLSYDFSFYIGRTGHIPKNFRSAALSTATQPW